ncbi:aminotransferase class IV [Caldicellulosiruptor morganii]|uniref:Aminotransferase class IV n=1 Tax=Caldicellulosiruptor morganii TaxID=1387555 RepID=A0ABY7BN95_9FIRM|nr:aminotransferase class IV [Caldicellulosiruptor morganii]WAM34294.1 aminotransferase class IV [Caldicellulosiruptor morganii]
MFLADGFDDFRFGLLPFETIYYQEGRPHFLYEHFMRLKRAFWILKQPCKIGFDEFERMVLDYIFSASKNYGSIRVTYFKNTLIIEEKEIRYSKQLFTGGLSLKIARSRKDSKNILNYIKTFNMGLNFIEEARAKEKGYDSCLFLNQNGFVCEAAFANVFFRKGTTLYTPHLSCGLLSGIVRKKVCLIAQNLNYQVKKEFLSLDAISKMDECFITSSIAGVFPVKKIDRFEFSSREFVDTISEYEYFKRPWHAK